MREQVIVRAVVSFVVVAVILALLAACAPTPTPQVIKETVVVTKEVPAETVKGAPAEGVREVPMTLPTLAEKIRSGEIDVGEELGMAVDQRYHNIHTGVLGLECATCHAAKLTSREGIFFQRLSPNAPAPVDRRTCLGCHRAGLASPLYTYGAP